MSKITKVKISDIGQTITGKTPSSNDPEDFGSEFMFVTPSDSFDKKMMNFTERYLSVEGVEKLSNKLLPPKSIMVTCIGSAMGKVAMNETSCITNQQINSIVPNKRYDSDYIYYAIKNNFKVLRNAATGSTALPLLNKTDFDILEIPIHVDKTYQQKISSVLSPIDTKIELNNRINRELEAMAKTLYDYWFVQFDFPNEQGKPYKSSGGKMVYNAELKRQIPEEWEVKTLAKVTAVSNESVIPMLTPEQEFKHYSIPTYDSTKTYGIEKGIDIRSNKFVVAESDILVSKLNPWFSRVIYPIKEDDLICSTEFVVWRTSNTNIKNYLFMVAKGEHFISHCSQSATGTSNSHKRVNPTVMMRYKVPFNSEVIQKFGATINSWIKIGINKQIENKQLVELRDWLLPMLMNGQVTVKEAEESLSMAAEPSVVYKKG